MHTWRKIMNLYDDIAQEEHWDFLRSLGDAVRDVELNIRLIHEPPPPPSEEEWAAIIASYEADSYDGR